MKNNVQKLYFISWAIIIIVAITAFSIWPFFKFFHWKGLIFPTIGLLLLMFLAYKHEKIRKIENIKSSYQIVSVLDGEKLDTKKIALEGKHFREKQILAAVAAVIFVLLLIFASALVFH